jgi:hypothetical protein
MWMRGKMKSEHLAVQLDNLVDIRRIAALLKARVKKRCKLIKEPSPRRMCLTQEMQHFLLPLDGFLQVFHPTELCEAAE